MKENILIYASELAACIGKNPYKSQLESINIVYNRHNNICHKEIPDEILNQVDTTLLCEYNNTMNNDQTINTIENNKNIINNFNITDTEKTILFNYVKNNTCSQYGTNGEDKLLKNNSSIQKDNIFKKRLLYEDNDYKVFLGGKSDGIKDNNLIEIKTRMYKLFKVVKEYEKIQVYSYLYIYNINKATLIEQYKEESLEHDINFDLEIFNNLII